MAADYCDGRPKLGMTTTVYYNPTMSTEKVRCGGGKRWVRTGRGRGHYVQNEGATYNAIVDHTGRTIRDCKTIRAALKMQGSATVFENFDINGRPSRAVAIYKVTGKGGIGKETLDPETACPAGYGRENICLNPFKMVAAPPGYQAGEMIHVPDTVGMKYPEFPGQPKSEWAIHDGNWIVGDSGSAIQANKRHGLGRFDFFSGLMHWRDPNNPLTNNSKNDFGKSTHKKFCKVDADTARKIRGQQSYPNFPETLLAGWLNGVSSPSVAPMNPPAAVAELPSRPGQPAVTAAPKAKVEAKTQVAERYRFGESGFSDREARAVN